MSGYGRLQAGVGPGTGLRVREMPWFPIEEQPKVDVRSHGETVLDELVVDDWLHLEQMRENEWWLRVGEATFSIHIKRGEARVWLNSGRVNADTFEVLDRLGPN